MNLPANIIFCIHLLLPVTILHQVVIIEAAVRTESPSDIEDFDSKSYNKWLLPSTLDDPTGQLLQIHDQNYTLDNLKAAYLDIRQKGDQAEAYRRSPAIVKYFDILYSHSPSSKPKNNKSELMEAYVKANAAAAKCIQLWALGKAYAKVIVRFDKWIKLMAVNGGTSTTNEAIALKVKLDKAVAHLVEKLDDLGLTKPPLLPFNASDPEVAKYVHFEAPQKQSSFQKLACKSLVILGLTGLLYQLAKYYNLFPWSQSNLLQNGTNNLAHTVGHITARTRNVLSPALIVLAILTLVIILIITWYYFRYHRNSQSKKNEDVDQAPKTTETPGTPSSDLPEV